MVISLLRRRDRLDAFKERWLAAGSPLRVRICWAVDGGASGQYASHLKALEGVEEGPLLVLEDDAVFADGFADRLRELEPIGPWDLIYLGGELVGNEMPVRPGLVQVTAARRTHAYIARDPAKVAGLLRRGTGARLDSVLATQRLTTHALLPFPVGQAGGLGSDVQDQDREDDQFWQPLGFA